MRTRLTILFVLCITHFLQAQLVVKPIRTARTNTTQKTLTLPFWDDFSLSRDVPDTTLWLNGSSVLINATIGQNAPTYNTATFDGLNAYGSAYDKTSEHNGAGDSLVSQPIDLSTIPASKRDSVYLSFYWQAGGYGDLPDEEDSLVLFFKKKDKDNNFQWVQNWSVKGGVISDSFEQELRNLDSASYYHSSFQFKFVSYSSKTGPFDTWNLDYVYLNANRSATDFNELDQAITGAPSLLFAPYYEIPAKVFFNNPDQYLANQQVYMQNLSVFFNPVQSEYTLKNLTTTEDYGTYSMGLGIVEGLERREISNGGFGSMTIPIQEEPLDSQVLESTFKLIVPKNNNLLYEVTKLKDTIYSNIDLRLNDTLRSKYLLHNYYAYDDGSAEFALAINSKNGQVAVKFGLGEQDILTHVDIYIPSMVPDFVDETLDIIVWNRLDENNILARKSITIQEPTGINEFTRVAFSTPVQVSDTVYIGFEQYSENYLGIGFDQSNREAGDKIYINTSGTWEQNTEYSGAFMIRPVFAYDSAYKLSAEPEIVNMVYPNPSFGTFKIKGEYNSVAVFDLSGQLIYESSPKATHELTNAKDGIYLLKITSRNHIYSQKLVVQHE